MDSDFDGCISQQDLKKFIVEVLKLNESEVTGPRLDRLFKLMDQFKRGKIQFVDLKRVLELNFDKKTPNQSLVLDFSWIKNAQQQIGLVLSRNFNSCTESFDYISGSQKQLNFREFKNYIDSSRALEGFDYTEKLLLQLFSYLDPHKKAYLIENDWKIAFDNYSWTEQMVTELKQQILNEFQSVQEAFLHFAKDQGVINVQNFENQLENLIPKRFTQSDKLILWKKICKSGEVLNQSDFVEQFGNGQYRAKTLKSSASIDLHRNTSYNFNKSYGTSKFQYTDEQLENVQPNNNDFDIINKKRNLLRIPDFDNILKDCLPDENNDITILQFRNVIMKQNLALSPTEIQQIINVLGRADGKINIDAFKNSLKFSQGNAGKRILERVKTRLCIIRDNICAYMGTPQDAFHRFDSDRNGYLTFEEFSDLLDNLAGLGNQPKISFNIKKDLFKFIDIRQDGQLDIQEWLQAFRITNKLLDTDIYKRCSTVRFQDEEKGDQKEVLEQRTFDPFGRPMLKPGQRMAFVRENFHLKNTIIYPNKDNQPILEKIDPSYVNWETSQEFDLIMRTLGRNRKLLQEIFSNMAKMGPITVVQAKKVIGRILRCININIAEMNWNHLLNFATKDGQIDYVLLLNTLKIKNQAVGAHPRTNLLMSSQSAVTL